MSAPVDNGATDASGKGPAIGYSLNSLCFILFMIISMINMNTCTYYVSLTIVMIIVYLINFGIKIYRKMPKILTGSPLR
jgi:hypothetical protein